ncbi:V-type ATP synthase subunit F [Fundicoccus culcitae]|uniref:V-type ATP synthase subunit F n=1 Tax=Fundicoccus culcitae TaxID=2969821 RepID=A0ABY5P5K2_9LACT|nr:V-type ATP synthase subunit F [Fundicoccus culcitae]UUX33964.1 V-type ATP synthase subunit F [Fundicoccus culcitae]
MSENDYRIAVVGNRDAILPFKMLGFDAFSTTKAKEAAAILNDLAEKKYGVIYITEDIAELIPDTIRYFDSVITPAVILIPTHKEGNGLGMARIRENVEKAIGADIL